MTSSSSNQVSNADQVRVNASRTVSTGASGWRRAARGSTRSPITTSNSSLGPRARTCRTHLDLDVGWREEVLGEVGVLPDQQGRGGVDHQITGAERTDSR